MLQTIFKSLGRCPFSQIKVTLVNMNENKIFTKKKINLMKPPYKTHKFDKNVLPNETVTDKAELLRYF
jgi:hypothetical protein